MYHYLGLQRSVTFLGFNLQSVTKDTSHMLTYNQSHLTPSYKWKSSKCNGSNSIEQKERSKSADLQMGASRMVRTHTHTPPIQLGMQHVLSLGAFQNEQNMQLQNEPLVS